MTQMTPLDTAFARFNADPDNETLRRGYFAALWRAEIHMLLEDEPGDAIEPVLIDNDGAKFALGFDTPERLAVFAEVPSPSAIMSGADVAGVLRPARLGLGLNLGVSDSAYLVPHDVIGWLIDQAEGAQASDVEGDDFAVPNVDEPFVAALDLCLAGLAGQARQAHFVQAPPAVPIILLDGVDASYRGPVTKVLAEFFALMGAGTPGIVFDNHASADLIQKSGITFDLPDVPATPPPGGDPTKPPKLR